MGGGNIIYLTMVLLVILISIAIITNWQRSKMLKTVSKENFVIFEDHKKIKNSIKAGVVKGIQHIISYEHGDLKIDENKVARFLNFIKKVDIDNNQLEITHIPLDTDEDHRFNNSLNLIGNELYNMLSHAILTFGFSKNIMNTLIGLVSAPKINLQIVPDEQ
jgi:hypothetical protein